MSTVAELFERGASVAPPPPPPGFEPEAAPPPPPGFVPPDQVKGQGFGQGMLRGAGIDVRALGDTAAGLGDFIANIPANVGNALDYPGRALAESMGQGPQRAPFSTAPRLENAADALMTKAGLPSPANAPERVVTAAIKGAGAMAAGNKVGEVLKVAEAAPGIVSAIGDAISGTPVKNVLAGAASGAAGQTTAEAGGGPVPQTVAALLAGIGTYGVAGAVERTAVRARTLPETIAAVPREAAIDAEGDLTDEGREIATRHGATTKELKGAYEDAAKAPEVPAAPAAGPATSLDDIVASAERAGVSLSAHEGRSGITIGKIVVPEEARGQGVGSRVMDDLATYADEAGQTIKLTPSQDFGGSVGRLREFYKRFGFVENSGRNKDFTISERMFRPPVERAPAAEVASPEAPPTAQEAPVEPPAPGEPQPDALPAPAAQRLSQAASEGVQLTRGQATQDFDTQVAENDLKASSGPAATQARLFAQNQQAQIAQMADNFKAALGDTGATAADRGQVVQDAIHGLRDQGKAGVTALYDIAKATPGSDAPLATGGILDAADKLILETPMEQGSKDALERAMAKFGVLPGKVETDGRYASIVTDDGRRIRVLGNVQPLTLANAEDFRQSLNAAWDKDGLIGRAIKALDDTVDEALKSGADNARTNAFKAARGAAAKEAETFKGKDIVADIVGWKGGTRTPKLDPERVVQRALGGGADHITDLRRIKAVLLSKPTEKSRAAWAALRAHGVAQIFDKALSPNGELSGARLTSAIKAFGPAKLKILLGDEDFNQLMKIQRITRDATVPLANTTNPSGSGYAVIRFLTGQTLKLGGSVMRFVPGIGHVMDAATGLAKIGKDARVSEKTLRGMTDFTARDAAKVDVPKTNPADFAREFINTAGSDRILAPLLAIEVEPKGKPQ